MEDKLFNLAKKYMEMAINAESRGDLEEAQYYYAQAAKWFWESSKYVPPEIGKIRKEEALKCEKRIEKIKKMYRKANGIELEVDENSPEKKVYEEIQSEIKFDDIVGLDNVKEKIKIALLYPEKYPDLYREYGIRKGGRILMYGPPGCGKTYLAKACGGEIGIPLITTDASLLLSKWVGEAEKNISTLFERVREMGKVILFIDEIDSLGASRSIVSGSTVARRVVTQFLTEIDNLPEGILLIAATNHPWDLDAALLRSGRFGTPVFIPPPDFNARIELFKRCVDGSSHENLDFAWLASKTRLYSAADIVAENGICEQAKKLALLESIKSGNKVPVNMMHFERVLNGMYVKPTIFYWVREAQNKLKRNSLLRETYPEMVKFINEYIQNMDNKR